MSIETYTIAHQRLHPEIIRVLQPWFADLDPPLSLRTVKIIIPRTWIIESIFNLHETRNPNIYVPWNKIKIKPGCFNAAITENPDAIDLYHPSGIGTLAHELYHIRQYRLNGWWWMTARYFESIRAALFGDGWHSTEWEKDAEQFGRQIENSFGGYPNPELEVFKALR